MPQNLKELCKSLDWSLLRLARATQMGSDRLYRASGHSSAPAMAGRLFPAEIERIAAALGVGRDAVLDALNESARRMAAGAEATPVAACASEGLGESRTA